MDEEEDRVDLDCFLPYMNRNQRRTNELKVQALLEDGLSNAQVVCSYVGIS